MKSEEITKLYEEMCSKFAGGLSNKSTTKFKSFSDYFAKEFNLNEEDIYITGAGTRPSNLEVRLSQGRQSVKHTVLGVAFAVVSKQSDDAIKKLTDSCMVTIRKFIDKGKSSYDNVLILVVDGNDVYPSGLIYAKGSVIATSIISKYDIDNITECSDDGIIDSDGNEGTTEAESNPVVNTTFDLNNEDIENLILYGPPGTGKTFEIQKFTKNLTYKDDYLISTFHQSMSYEEFVEGIKPVLENVNDVIDNNSKEEKKGSTSTGEIKYQITNGLFKIACEQAAKKMGYSSLKDCINDTKENRRNNAIKAIDNKNVYLLCIDEINRGNVASIFGELITLIEDSKRLGAEYEMTTILPYSQQAFGVPANLFLVGTMNTADRSIQLLDSALRRRFRFIELLPNYNLKYKNNKANIILKRINTKIRSLLNKDSQIGHSYLMNATSDYELLSAIIGKIVPLLEEYFYNDIQKVRFVLNENDNTKYPLYIEDTEAKQSFESYIAYEDIDTEDKSFFVFNDAIKLIKDENICSRYLDHLLGKQEIIDE